MALGVLMLGMCLSAITGLGALLGITDAHYVSTIFGFTWKLWLWWLGATFVGLGISYHNTCRHEAACHG
ncbi:MAG: hypothetical protein WC497_02095 [Patescibacteria group bacterium]